MQVSIKRQDALALCSIVDVLEGLNVGLVHLLAVTKTVDCLNVRCRTAITTWTSGTSDGLSPRDLPPRATNCSNTDIGNAWGVMEFKWFVIPFNLA